MASDYILIGADVVPTKHNVDLFIKGDALQLVGEELDMLLKGANFRIFNLEVPLTDVAKPIVKCGPHLIAPTATVQGYKALGANLLTLANNHILDQGVQGLERTIITLDEADISHVGIGHTLEEAAKPFCFQFAGKKIGVYACAEHEFSIASEQDPGANPFDPLYSLDHILELKKRCDFVIVLYHGGKEHYRYPSPWLQKACRRMVDKGADLVIGQHSHCIGCEEKYKNGIILYGQGNFLFDYSNSVFWKTSLLVKLNADYTVSYVPVVKEGYGVRLASQDAAATIIREFNERSNQIKAPMFVEKEYSKFAFKHRKDYYSRFSGRVGRMFLVRLFNKLMDNLFFDYLYRSRFLPPIENVLDCEAHRELASEVMKLNRRQC